MKGGRPTAAVILLSLVAACSSDRSTAPQGTVLTDSQVSRDVAVLAGSAVADIVQDFGDNLSAAGIAPSVRIPLSPSRVSPSRAISLAVPGAVFDGSTTSATAKRSCTYDAGTGRWNCAPLVNARGLTVTLSYAYFDAAGTVMPTFSRTLTAAISYQSTVTGPVGNGSTITGVVHRTANYRVSGLINPGTTRIWNGSSVNADTSTRSSKGTTRRYAGVRNDTLIAVTYPQPRPPGTYPLSGSTVQRVAYTVTLSGSNTERRTIMRRIVTTYNGTSEAKVQVGNITCTLHLDTRTVDGCSSK